MNFLSNDVLGILFLIIAGVLTLLMFRAWVYPYDKEKHRSSAPRRLIWTHRILGYLFIVIYLMMMWQMVPRLWEYQVELPARTVAHLLLGMAIGGILLVKLAIVRFFKHMEAKLVPILGTGLFICTLLLVGLALPLNLREAYLKDSAQMGEAFSDERIARVREQLPKTGLDDPALLDELATSDALLDGRNVLVNKCVQCHDLRTILARPRTPENWRQTVKRMADRSSTAASPIIATEEWQVTAYLIAISPTLQRTLAEKRQLDNKTAVAQEAAATTAKAMMGSAIPDGFNIDEARTVFETTCSQCHAHLLVEAKPPGSKQESVELVQRMVRNGLVASDDALATVIQYLTATYAPDDTGPGEPAAAASSAGTADTVLTVNPLGEDLQFEQDTLSAKAGSNVKLVFNNTAGIDHNFVLVNTAEISDDVVTASYGAAGNGFLPEHADVIAGIPATAPGSTSEISFKMPEPGQYRFVCLFPGHNLTMKGTLTSEE